MTQNLASRIIKERRAYLAAKPRSERKAAKHRELVWLMVKQLKAEQRAEKHR